MQRNHNDKPNENLMDIRAKFLEYFATKGHKIYPSMPLVPDDASLLFTNAGMVQFKDIFTGKIPIPTPPRATSSQLCIRAGGKHNDLENVGYTARHHTLFEMLGNFSFGDYFKKEAIAHAWEFVTQELGFDKSVLYVTIHESDDEAYALWCEHIAPERIKRMGDKDNFWQMGDTGPCGPCSEIYVDQGAEFFHSNEDYFGGEGDRFLEIWNLVFMQYEQKDGKRTPLPKPSIDTGMGLERVVALKEGEINNFDSSLFAPIMQRIEKLTGKSYYRDSEILRNTMGFAVEKIESLKKDVASFRVIADHARSVAFLLAQGVNFDKEGRGYVLRRILRRAVRHGYLLGLKKPFLHKVVESVCESMGAHYGFLNERKAAIMQQCETEEARFFETIESGMNLFQAELDSMQKSGGKVFKGDIAFKLYDTYGFPLDLTQDMLRELNIEVDLQSFEACMQSQKARGKASWKGSGDALKNGDFSALLSEFGENAFIGYEAVSAESTILALLDSNFKRVEFLESGQEGWVMLESTPFYPESGGPIGDKGLLLGHSVLSDSSLGNHLHNRVAMLHCGARSSASHSHSDTIAQSHTANTRIVEANGTDSQGGCADSATPESSVLAKVLDTQKFFGLNLSRVKALAPLQAGQKVFAQVDSVRLEIAKHHSATHLLHYALREILGSHIAQAGSLVESNRLRFDFSHPKALSQSELNAIESLVNAQIARASSQICESMDIESAKAKGAMALFGEKYGERVRVITFGDSIELCGGIHVGNSAEIGSFYIVKESGVSSGVRRIEAVCGAAAFMHGKAALDSLKAAKDALKANDLMQGITRLQNELKEAKAKAKQSQNVGTKELEFERINGVKLIVLQLDSTAPKEAKELVDRAKNENEKVAILLLSHEVESAESKNAESKKEGKIAITAGVKGVAGLKAGAWVKEVAQSLGGNGGGRDDFATAGVKEIKDSSDITHALELAKNSAKKALL